MMRSDKSLLLVLLVLVSVILTVVGCNSYSGSHTSYTPLDETKLPYVDTSGAEMHGENDGRQAGRDAFISDPENSSESADAPDSGGYSTEEQRSAYRQAWTDGYNSGYLEAYDELVERYQQEHPEGD